MYSHGGRGGRVLVVTNLNDHGPGSFREVCETGGPRIIVFNVAGIIRLDERLIVRAPYITIDASRAPGDGVCIAGDTVELATHDVVIRHMRFRRGSTWVGDRNYFKPGPATNRRQPVSYRFLKPEARRSKEFNTDFGRVYVTGNIAEGHERVTKNNWDGGIQVDEYEGYDPTVILPKLRSEDPYPHAYLEIESAEAAFAHELEDAGATLPKRDPVDLHVVEMVRTGKVPHNEGNGIIKDISEVGGYPDYRGMPYIDSDGDGMSDAWERQCGLNANDANDAKEVEDGGSYTNIECFLYRLDPHHQPDLQTPRKFRDLFNQRAE